MGVSYEEVAAKPEPEEQYAIHAGWLVGVTSECTCGMAPHGHLPECGMEPLASMEQVLDALREQVDRAAAAQITVGPPRVLRVPDDPAEWETPWWRGVIAQTRADAGEAGVLMVPMSKPQGSEPF